MTRYRGLLVLALAFVAGAFFVPAAVHAVPRLFQEKQEKSEEEKAHQKAQELWGAGQYAKAATAYEKLIADYPDSKSIEEYEWLLVHAEMNGQKMRSAREHAEKFVAARPKGKHAAELLGIVAQLLAQSGKKDEAKAAFKRLFKEYPNTNASQSALWQYWNLVEKQFQFHVNQSWTEGEQPVVYGYLRNVDEVAFKLYKLDTAEVLKKVEAGQMMQNVQELVATVPASARKPIKEWGETPNVKKTEWKTIEFKPDIKDAGLYLFEATHDEISMHVSIVVARYGLVTKAGGNKTIAFAVDRRSGKPIAGMAIHAADGKNVQKGATDEQGLCVFDKGLNGAVVGIKDGELALSNVYFYGEGDQQKIYFFTDRPVYRPNNVVHWKGIFRTEKDGEFKTQANLKTRVEIRDPRWNLVYQKEHTTDAFGAIVGDFTIGDEPPLGMYYVQTSNGGHGQFGVEEYRKPEYEVSVAFDGKPYTTGDSVKGAVSVNYYFGSPVVEADVTYTIYRRQYWKPYWRYWGCDWCFDDDEDGDEEEGMRHGKGGRGWYGYGETIYNGTGKTDKEGRLTFDFNPPKVEFDAVYTVHAAVTDKSRRQVTGSADAKMTRSNIELNISAGRYVYTPGDKVAIKVKASDIDGKAVPGQAIKFRASTANWHWKKKNEIGEYEYGDFFNGESKTDEQGMADFSFTAEKEGYIRFYAITEDKKGNPVTAEHWVWISGYQWSGSFENLVGLDLIPDQDGYKIGDTARVLLTSSRKNIYVLVTTECEGIYSHKVVHVTGHTTMIDVPLTEKRMTPNVYVTATTLVKNEYLTKSKSLAVAPTHGLLNVNVTTDKKAYRPRETAEVNVEVTDAQGKPVEAQLSVGIVDESIYAVQEEHARDMRKFFYAKRYNRVYTMTSMHFWDYGRAESADHNESSGGDRGANAPAAAKEPQGGRARKGDSEKKLKDGKANSGAMAETETRAYFPDTMLWMPTIVTGKDGRFSFKTTMPDSLTEWRTTVRAITADTKVGNVVHSVIARKEVIIRLTTPRFFTQNDECTISGVVHNYRDDVDEIRVTLQAEGVEVIGDRDVKIHVKKGEDKRVDWKVIVKKAGTAVLLAKAETPVESDAMKLSLPILPHGAMQYQAKAGTVEKDASIKVSVPKTAIAEASEMRITVSPSVASQVLDALEYLAGYPYGCVEQTMSRFLPTVTVARAMQKLNLPKGKVPEDLPDMVNAGLQRLYNFQHGDGGWGWWEADQSNPFMTAYVVYGLTKAKEADFAVEPNVIERGVQALQEMIKRSKNHGAKDWHFGSEVDARAYMVFAMSEAGRTDKKMLESFYEERKELSNYSKGLLALCLMKAKMKEEAAVVLANLDETAKSGEAYCYWEGFQQRWHWMSNNIETTAYILKAIVANDPKDPKIHKIVRWLASNRHGNRWYSTKDTAAIVYALTDYIEASGELDADYELVVKLNGREFMKQHITKENVLTFDGNKLLKAAEFINGDNEITIEKKGKGALYYAVYLKYFNAVEDFKPTEGTVKIQRTYFKVTYEGKERITEELKDGATVQSGDLVEVRLDITADGLHEYMMIEDPLPAGVEVQKEERFYSGWGWRGRHWGWWYSRVEARDNRVCIAATYLNGAQTVSYLVRAETPGDFHVLPASAYNMYVPEMAGTSAENRLRIVEKK